MQEDASFNIVDRTLIIKLNCELDHHNSEQIRKRADNIIDTKVIKNIIFDFENVTFMDSSGLGVIMGRYKKILFNRGKVIVINVDNRVDRIMRMSGLYKIVESCSSLDNALKIIENK